MKSLNEIFSHHFHFLKNFVEIYLTERKKFDKDFPSFECEGSFSREAI